MLRAEYSFQFRGRISLQLTEPAPNFVLSSEIKNNDFEITAERREGPMRSPTLPTRLPIENGIMAQEPRFRSVRKNSICDHSHHASFVMKGVENSHPSHIPRQIVLINITHDRCRVLIPALRISPLNRSSCVFFLCEVDDCTEREILNRDASGDRCANDASSSYLLVRMSLLS